PQVAEDFSDGDWTQAPPWNGNTGDWTINAGKQLQSNNTVANSSYSISTSNSLATMARWDLYLRLNFNTSSANYVDIYVIASASDLSLPSTTGYFIRVGNTQDEIALYRKDPGGVIVKLIDGVDGLTNH